MLRKIGVRAHDYGKSSMEDLARQIREDNYETIQLATAKAIVGVDGITDGFSPTVISQVNNALDKWNIDISVLGVYLNYGTSDEEARLKNVNTYINYVENAKSFGARVVGTETGSLDVNYKSHKDNFSQMAFNRLRTSLEKVVEQGEKHQVIVAIEPVANHILNDAKRIKQMIDEIKSPYLKAIFDPVNVITPDNYKNQDYMLEEAFDILGEDILVAHAKDFIIQEGKRVVVSPGDGLLNYELFAKMVLESKSEIDVLAENNPKTELNRVNKFLQEHFSN